MSGPMPLAGQVGGASMPTIPGSPTNTSTVDARDANDFASQMNEPASEEADLQEQFVESLKRNSFQTFSDQQNKMIEEIKKDMS